MAYHKIPKKFDLEDIAASLKALILYSGSVDTAAVISRMVDEMGCKPRTIYAVLAGEIKMSLDFLHAAVIATGGHPEVSRYLEPDGFNLSRRGDDAHPDKSTLAEECLDDVPALAGFHAVLQNKSSTLSDVWRSRAEVDRELDENVFFFKNNKTGGER